MSDRARGRKGGRGRGGRRSDRPFRPVEIWHRGRDLDLEQVAAPFSPFAAQTPLEIEIGFGKGRYLLARAAETPNRGFVGIEAAPAYFRVAKRRAERRRLDNVALFCGEALYLAAACLEHRRAEAVHVYFPDPWPKSRHERRRLFDPVNLDLLLSLLVPRGRLYFATDHADYGQVVLEVLRSHGTLDVSVHEGAWPGGARTNYEVKYEREGRPILRLVAQLRAGDESGDVAGAHPSLTVGYDRQS